MLITSTTGRAQERGGTVTGLVTDAGHYVLPGARIDLRPLGQSAVSDPDGRFTIANVKPGDYTLTVSYVGLQPFKKSISVQAALIVRVDAVLQVPGVQEELTVSAERPRGEAAALNEQRTSPNIVQILPAEVITSLPNTNVADAIGRLPSVSLERDEGEGKYVQIRGTDPRLSNLTINGVHVPSPESGPRNVKLDIIPSDIVGSIEVNKTLSANQDADAIGGSVNLVTKVPGEKPFASVGFMGGYTNIIGGRGLTQFAATGGTRLGAEKQWGVLGGGSYDWNGRGIDDLEPSPDVADIGGSSVPVFTALDLREYRYYRSRVGAGRRRRPSQPFRRDVLRPRAVLQLQELRRPLGVLAKRRRLPDADGDRQQRLDGCVAAESAAQRADRQRLRAAGNTRWDRSWSTTSCPARTHARTVSIRRASTSPDPPTSPTAWTPAIRTSPRSRC